MLRHRFMSLALDGIPTCKLCLRKFAAWPPFLNHHATQSCPGQPSRPSGADESADVSEAFSSTADIPSTEQQIPLTQPLLPQPLPSPIRPPPGLTPQFPPSALASDPHTIALAQAPDWRPLAEVLRAKHRDQGLRHCPVCHQWFTRTQDIFRHLRKQHPLALALDTERTNWLAARTVGARSPCSWCSAKASYKTQHVTACPVLQQTITLRLLLRSSDCHDSQRSDRIHDSAEAEGCRSRACSPRMLGREPTSDSTDGHRTLGRREEGHFPRSGAEEIPSQRIEGKWRWERLWRSTSSTDAPTSSSNPSNSGRAERDKHGRNDVDDGQDAAEVGGSDGPGTLSERVRDVLPSVITYEHHTPPGQEKRTLARAQGSEGHGALSGSPCLSLPLHVRCHPEATSGDCEEPNTTRGSAAASSLPTGQGGRASTHSLPDVQHRDSSAGTQDGPSSSHSRARCGDPCGHPQALPRLIGHPSLPSHSTALGAHPGPHPPLSPPSGESAQSLVRALRQPDSSDQFRSLAAGGRLSSHREDVSQSPRSRAAEATSETARALILPTASIENRGNHCYANATLQAVHWLCSFLPATQEIWVTAMRTVMQRMCLQARIPDLWSALPWSLAHSSWQRPHQQHDAAEYLSCFRRFLIPDLTSGGWQRRILHQHPPDALCEVTDRGETWPLFISTPISQLPAETRLNLTVQKLLHIWQGEAAILRLRFCCHFS